MNAHTIKLELDTAEAEEKMCKLEERINKIKEASKGIEPLPKLVYSVPETAEILGCNSNAVGNYIKEGQLKYLSFGSHRKIAKWELERFIRENEKIY